MGQHVCMTDGAEVASTLNVPPFKWPDSPVALPGGLHGRVRLLWTCCSSAMVERMADPDSDVDPATVTERYALDDLESIPWGVPYSVPCVGAAWSTVTLTCGHIGGEGCGCPAAGVCGLCEAAGVPLEAGTELCAGCASVRLLVTD